MIKFYCDSCGEEIKDMNENCSIKIQEKVLAFIKHQKADQFKAMEYVLCICCGRKVREFFQKPKTEE